MCGISGVIQAGSNPAIRFDAVQRMCQAMLHRGPDDAGLETHGAATLGMRRLAIFDPAHGHQPMTTTDRRFTLIFNGAIYNFKALRNELRAAGRPFHTECDTEVLLQAYAHWGESCLNKLRGMFAFAAWDAHEETLFLARDPFGIKPLYYQHEGPRLVFASELNALISSGLVLAELDPLSISDYLSWLAVPAPRTIYQDIFSLRPGESARFRNGRLEIKASWNFKSIPQDIPVCKSRGEFIGELRARLEETLRAHVVADVPVGAFLSGGLDSAVIAGLMGRVSGTRLKTFSIGFDEAEFSEAYYAAETARHFGADHHPVILTGAEVATDIETLVSALDQPTGDGINTYYVSRAALAGGVTVALSGLGGDELFGGYPSFRYAPQLHSWLKYWRTLPRVMQNPVLTSLRRRGTSSRKLADILQHARTFNEVASLQRQVFSSRGRSVLLHRSVRHLVEDRPVFHPELAALNSELIYADPLSRVSAWELRTYMSDVLLRDSDVMSMRHSLELRVPFVDRPLIEWLWRQPADFRYEPGKRILAEATKDILPPSLLQRKKRGFSLPFPIWMKRELKPFLDHTFSEQSIGHSGLFDRTITRQVWHNYLKNDDPQQWSRVWSLAMMLAFAARRTPARHAISPRPAVSLFSRSESVHADFKKLPPYENITRTLLITPEIFSSEGGIQRIMRVYLKALCELAGPTETVSLLSLNDSTFDSADLRSYSNEKLEEWQAQNRNKIQFARTVFRMSRGAHRIVCGHVGQLPVTYLAKKLNPELRYYLVAHGIEVWKNFSLPERLALRGAEKILCVSDYTRRELLRRCPLPEGKAVVLPNALDPQFQIMAGDKPASPPVILVVSRLLRSDRYKGVEHMIQAMPAVRAAIPGTVLRIIGRGDDLPRLQTMSAKLGVQASVQFVGYASDEELTTSLRACSLFALPSKKEGFGLVFLEAMAGGRPCLGAHAGGIPEVITPESGVLVEYGDVPGISTACIYALQRRWDQEAILARARYFSYSEFRTRLSALIST